MYYTYILRLPDGYYIGHSGDLRRRLQEHKKGGVFTTKNGKAGELVFYAAFKSEQKARDFEKYLKSSSGFAFRNKRLV
jgi:putative endonuclease